MGALYLIRHGQASFSKADYDQLSPLGERQARRLGAVLGKRLKDVDAVFSGSMRRHHQTAEHCLQAMSSLAPTRFEPALNEFDHQEIIVRYQPKYASRAYLVADMARTLSPRRRFQQMFSQACARWISGEHDHEYSQTWAQFRQRCVTALEALIAELGPSRTALVFTSGGPITAICQHLLQIPDEQAFRVNWTLVNCGITKIVYSANGQHLSSLNDHSHLEHGGRRKLISYR